MVDYPFTILSELVNLDFEEKDLAAASNYKSLLVDKVHISKIFVIDLLRIVVFLFFVLVMLSICLILVLLLWDINLDWHSERLSLPVEGIHLIVVRIVVALLREVLLVAREWHLRDAMDLLVAKGWQ